MKKSNKIPKRLVWLAVLTLLTALIWVALDSYHQLVEKDQLKKFNKLIKILNTELETDILTEIEARKEYQIDEIKEYFLPTPTATELEKISSPSAISTESGEISE